MTNNSKPFLCTQVERRIEEYIAERAPQKVREFSAMMLGGKLLRTRLAAALTGTESDPMNDTLVKACAATELAHTASLFHDDIVDNAEIRRGVSTLWKVTSRTKAVLVGDNLLCAALETVQSTGNIALAQLFIRMVSEVCNAEIEQEFIPADTKPSFDDLCRLARGKTGPLFAFTAFVAAASNVEQQTAFMECGYRLGCAFQLSDDIIDISGDEAIARKTLGTDRLKNKHTPALHDTARAAAECRNQYEAALRMVERWPDCRERLFEYIRNDLLPGKVQ